MTNNSNVGIPPRQSSCQKSTSGELDLIFTDKLLSGYSLHPFNHWVSSTNDPSVPLKYKVVTIRKSCKYGARYGLGVKVRCKGWSLSLSKYVQFKKVHCEFIDVVNDLKTQGVIPKIGDEVEFEINANFMRELTRKLLEGINDEDAYKHVRTVLEIVDLFLFPGVSHDAIMLRVFPITLKGRALRWKDRLPAGSITTCDLLKKEFIWRYCHPFITAKKLEEIRNFKQERDETLYYAWERYNDLLYQCPVHDLNCQQKVHIFYTGLDISTRKLLDSNGFIPLMTPTQALESIQVMADHSHDWGTSNQGVPSQKENGIIKHSRYMESLEETIIKFYEDTIKKQIADDERMRKILENTKSNIRALNTRTKNLQEKAYQLTHKVLTNTGEKVKAITTMGKENMKDLVPRDLPPTPFLGHLKEQIGIPYKTRETVCMNGNPEEIHNAKARDDERDMDVGWDIM
ncbi:ribonuclease H-like domain-containing protein [Tanacetum coccineum]